MATKSNTTQFQQIIDAIKEKREISGIDDQVITEVLNKVLRKNNLPTEKLGKLSQRDLRLLVKEARADLRRYSGQFSQIDHSNLQKHSQILKNSPISDSLLNSHSSTKERLSFYPELRALINSLKVRSIIDLGCGLNPIALASPDIEYYACDIKNDEIQIINNYFKSNKIKGEAFFCDIRKISSLPDCDLCLLLKVLDIIENKGHKIAEKILREVNSKYFLISFSTKTLSGKPMNHPQRGWIERLLHRLNYSFKIINSKNEIFYLATKNF